MHAAKDGLHGLWARYGAKIQVFPQIQAVRPDSFPGRTPFHGMPMRPSGATCTERGRNALRARAERVAPERPLQCAAKRRGDTPSPGKEKGKPSRKPRPDARGLEIEKRIMPY